MSYLPRLSDFRHLKTRLLVEALEDRIALSWGSTPPATITVPTSFTSVTLNSTGDATGTASITANENDFYRFTATATGSYVFSATTPSSSMDTVAATYSSTGSRLGYNDDISNSNRDSQFTISLTNGQVYYFGVTNYTGTAGGSYTWSINGPTPSGGGTDDAYENNDTLATAWNLGTLTAATTINNLQMRDSADWFRFTTSFTGTASHSVSIAFTHSQGDLDFKLYNSAGTQIGASTGTGNSETISLNGLAAGTYYVQAYGYQGVQNPNYSLTITPPSSGGGGGGGSAKVLYLQFDGASISRTDLVRYAGSSWDPNQLDSDQNGINIGSFLSSRSDRETIITQMISMIQTDLNAYGITVTRLTAGARAVEGVGATTIFLGQSTLTGGGFHIACDIDQGNNNPTDIAFVGNEDWGSANSTAITMADVTLHEAGHTWGLWHVASGTALESMGLRYNTPQSQWVQNTSFMNQTFNAYVSGGFAHGPGPQNAHATMMAWSGGAGGGPSGNLSQHDHDDHIDAGGLDSCYDDHDHHVEVAVPDISRSSSVASALMNSLREKLYLGTANPQASVKPGQSYQEWRTQIVNQRRGVPTTMPASLSAAGGQSAQMESASTDSLFACGESRWDRLGA